MIRYLHGIKLIESDFGQYLYDAHGNVTELLDNEYNVVQSYTYDPFGIENGAESSIRDTDMAEEMSIGDDMLMQSPDINGAIDDAAGLNSYTDPNPYRYCGEYFDNETGYVYLRARYYAPTLGRFISEDTVKDGYNWYVYCGNDPVNRVDPSGCFALATTLIAMGIGAIVGVTISATSSVAIQYATAGTVNWKSVGISAVTGLVSGMIAASPIGLVGQVVAGAVIGGFSYAADCYVNNEKISLGGLLVNITVGAISGYIGGSGANTNHELSNVANSTKRTIIRETRRANQEYAQKAIARSIAYRNEVFITSIWNSSVKYIGANIVSSIVTKIYGFLKQSEVTE